MEPKTPAFPSSRLSVAPMMDWTDRHCRYFHRCFTRHALLYTEMITTGAILYGDRERYLAFHADEHPVALQLGGSEPRDLETVCRDELVRRYDEINLNLGCPSDRVQSGCFGAALMRDPVRVSECMQAMIAGAGDVPVTAKCRIGVDDQDPARDLPDFLCMLRGAGIRSVTIHARKAWLEGLSPKQNRDIPPLDYELVHDMKREFSELHINLNGGIETLDSALAHLDRGLDGVMIGRAAYANPALLGACDRRFFGTTGTDITPHAAIRAMLPYIETEVSNGVRLNQITRHMLGAFHGLPGARAWRRALSDTAHRPGAGPDTVEAALSLVPEPEEAPASLALNIRGG